MVDFFEVSPTGHGVERRALAVRGEPPPGEYERSPGAYSRPKKIRRASGLSMAPGVDA